MYVWAGIATRYELHGPEIESRRGWGGARFFATVQSGLEVNPASYTMGTGSFPGVKRPKRGVDRPPPISAEDKYSEELYICSHSGHS